VTGFKRTLISSVAPAVSAGPPALVAARCETGAVVRWGEFESAAPALAAFGTRLLRTGPAYMATVRADGTPRVHPVSPIFSDGRLFVFMEPTSPKGADLQRGSGYALHNGVPDTLGTGGEFSVSGRAELVNARGLRAVAETAAGYDPPDRYCLFELLVTEARCNGYGDVTLPEPRRWSD